MHLNALYRAAGDGKDALVECVHALQSASKLGVFRLPLKYWRIRQAREHLEHAKRHLKIVRENVTVIASQAGPMQIDSSGGYAIADLLVGGLLDSAVHVRIDNRVMKRIDEVNALIEQVGELMLRMRKAGAVG